jgi:hypothetical protein
MFVLTSGGEMRTILSILFLMLLCTSNIRSQQVDSTKKVIIILADETEIVGKIIAKDSVNTTIKSLSGVVSVIPNKEIIEIKKVVSGNIVGNQLFPPDPADNRLMALPTGRPLKSGEVQFNAVELIFPHLLFGVSDFLSLGIGGLPFIGGGVGTLIYYLTSKITPINFKNAAVSVGGALVGSTATKEFVGVMYGVGTFGNSLNSVTAGTFFAFAKDEVFNRPAFLIGGSTRISKATTLITENVFIFGNDTEHHLIFPSIGIRFSGEKLAADFGTYAIIEENHFFYPIPWIGLSYKF